MRGDNGFRHYTRTFELSDPLFVCCSGLILLRGVPTRVRGIGQWETNCRRFEGCSQNQRGEGGEGSAAFARGAESRVIEKSKHSTEAGEK